MRWACLSDVVEWRLRLLHCRFANIIGAVLFRICFFLINVLSNTRYLLSYFENYTNVVSLYWFSFNSFPFLYIGVLLAVSYSYNFNAFVRIFIVPSSTEFIWFRKLPDVQMVCCFWNYCYIYINFFSKYLYIGRNF